MENLIIKALEKEYRYKAHRGNVATEDLFRMSIEHLGEIYGGLKDDLDKLSKASFLEVKSSKQEEIENKMAIITFVAERKKADVKAKEEAMAKAQEKSKLLDLLDKKKEEGLAQLSVEELEKKIREL